MKSFKHITKLFFVFTLATIISLSLYSFFTFTNAAAAPQTTTIIYVDADSTAVTPDGSSWANAYQYLHDGLAAAGTPVGGDIVEIWVADGIYYTDEGDGIPADSTDTQFEIGARVQLYGGFAGDETTKADRDWEANLTILSGDIGQDDDSDPNGVTRDAEDYVGTNAKGVVEISSGSAETVLDGFIVTAGINTAIVGPARAALERGSGIVISNSSATLANLTVIGNRGDKGGGIYIEFSTIPTTPVSITNVSILNNRANTNGGGIYSTKGNIEFTNVTIDGNNASTNGGGVNNTNGIMAFDDVRIRHNRVSHTGGGFYAGVGTQSFTNFVFESNESGSTSNAGGGGMFVFDGDTIMQDGMFRGNESGKHGGGLYAQDGIYQIINVVFSGNSAGSTGGGMLLNHNSEPVLTNVTVAGNVADEGGGIKLNSTDAIIQNSVVWGNEDGTGVATVGANVTQAVTSISTISYSNIQESGGSAAWSLVAGSDGGNNIDGDPKFDRAFDSSFAPTAAGSYRILATSDMIDAGNNGADLDGAAAMTTTVASVDADLDGSARISGATVDIGAHEYDTTISVSHPMTTTLFEGGEGVSMTIKLFSDPPAGKGNFVTVPLSTSNEECAVTPSQVTLSSANWNTGVEVVVSAVDDVLIDGNIDCWLETGRSQSVTAALDRFDPVDFLFTTINDDVPSMILSPETVTVTEGVSTTLTYFLNQQPTQQVLPLFSSDNPSCSMIDATPPGLDATNWEQGLEVTLITSSDNQINGTRICNIKAQIGTSDPAFNSGSFTNEVQITLLEGDAPGISFPTGNYVLTESQRINHLIRTDTIPSAPVTITLQSTSTSSAPIDCWINPSVTQINANIRNFSFQAVQDARTDGDTTCTISAVLESDDLNYDGLDVGTFTIDVIDTDTADFELIGATQMISAGGSAEVLFRLTTIPLESVTATLSSSDGCSVNPATIVFTNTADADDLEKIIVTPQSGSCTVQIMLESDDLHYNDMIVPDINITVPISSVYLPLIGK